MAQSSSRFPDEFDLDEPLVDGAAMIEGGSNRAVDRFNMLRDAISQIQSELGTNPQGSDSDVATRLSRRLSDSGIPRGFPSYAAETDRARDFGGDETLIHLIHEASFTKVGAPRWTFDWSSLVTYTTAPEMVFIQAVINWGAVTSDTLAHFCVTVDNVTTTSCDAYVWALSDGSFTFGGYDYEPHDGGSFFANILLIGGEQ